MTYVNLLWVTCRIVMGSFYQSHNSRSARRVWSSIQTMYMGDPHSVAAITPSCRNRAKPKSAASTTTWNRPFQLIAATLNHGETNQWLSTYCRAVVIWHSDHKHVMHSAVLHQLQPAVCDSRNWLQFISWLSVQLGIDTHITPWMILSCHYVFRCWCRVM